MSEITQVTQEKIKESVSEGGFNGEVGVNVFRATVLRSAMRTEISCGLKMGGDPWGLIDNAIEGLVAFDEVHRCINKAAVYEHVCELTDIQLVQALIDGDARTAKRAANRKPRVYRGTGDTDKVFSIGGILDVTKQQIIDLLCCGIESGSYADYLVHESKEPTDENDIPSAYNDIRHLAHCWGDGHVIFVDREEYYMADEDWREIDKFTLTEESIEKGLLLFAKTYKRHFADFFADNCDADTGLAFLHCCLQPENQ